MNASSHTSKHENPPRISTLEKIRRNRLEFWLMMRLGSNDDEAMRRQQSNGNTIHIPRYTTTMNIDPTKAVVPPGDIVPKELSKAVAMVTAVYSKVSWPVELSGKPPTRNIMQIVPITAPIKAIWERTMKEYKALPKDEHLRVSFR